MHPMRALMQLCEVAIDNKDGMGAVPDNQNVDYMGLRVRMKPSVFLKLAASVGDQAKNTDNMERHIRSGGAIGAPFLEIALPSAWFEKDYAKPARVMGHEGRHRMKSVQRVEGDAPIEVHLFFFGGVRNRNLTPEMVRRLNQELVPQKLNFVLFKGPYFAQ